MLLWNRCATGVGFVTLCVSMLLTAACGGGNSGNGSGPPPPPPPPASFTVSVSPGSITLTQGAAGQPLQVSLIAKNGFTGAATVTVVGLPSGVTVTPSSLSVTATSPGSFTLTASGSASISQGPVAVNAVSGALTADNSVQLTVSGTAPPDPFHLVGGTMTHGFYDENRQLLFTPNLGLNELDVISSVDFSVQARVPLPQPFGIDQMADGKTLVIGTIAQELLTVDENTFAVTRHPFSAAGSGGFSLFFPNVVALANGKVIVIGQEPGIDSSDIIDGGQYLYEWDSKANTFTQLEPTGSNPWETDSLARSADHKWAIFSGDQFYLYSSDSNSLKSAPLSTVDPPDDSFGVRGYAINSNGSEIAVVSASQVTFLNSSLVALGSTPIPNAFQNARTAVQFSTDDSKLYIQFDGPLAIEEIDTTTYAVLGSRSAETIPGSNLDRLLATDSQGHAYLGTGGGIRFVDLTQPPVPNNSSGIQIPNCPTLGIALPLNTSMQLTLATAYSGTLLSVYVGAQAAPLLNGATILSIPASSTVGPADVQCVGTSGDTVAYADAVSYGVQPIGFSANLLPPTGNPPAYLFGFGLSAQAFEVPSIDFGGQPATNVAELEPDQDGVPQAAAMQVPNGNPGDAPVISVSSSAGSGTLSGATSYYASPTIVPATGLLQLLYDTHRNVVYALKPTEVDVLDPVTLQWQSPISFPATATGTFGMMALSPDGSKLVVEGLTPNNIPEAIVFDPDRISPPAVASSPTEAQVTGSIVITASNKVIFAGSPAIELDLASLTFTPLSVNTGALLRSTPDGNHIFGADLNVSSGEVYSVDPVTFAVQTEFFGQIFWADLTVSPDGSQFAPIDIVPFAAGDIVGFFDPGLRYLNTNVYPAFSPPDDAGAIGSAYSPQGKVVVVPLGDSIEFWDAENGTLRARLMTPEELKVIMYPEGAAPPIMALDPTGQMIYAISNSGVTVLKLPQPIDQMTPAQWPQTRVHNSDQAKFHGSITSREAALRRKSK
jgi:hypothetical protein